MLVFEAALEESGLVAVVTVLPLPVPQLSSDLCASGLRRGLSASSMSEAAMRFSWKNVLAKVVRSSEAGAVLQRHLENETRGRIV